MSRLPMAGQPVAASDGAELPRLSIVRRLFVVASVRDEGPAFRFAAAFAEAFEGPLDVVAAVEAERFSERVWELGPHRGRRIFGPLSALPAPFEDLVRSTEPDHWLLAVGAPAAVMLEATWAVRLTGGLSPLAWRPIARGFHAHLDLVEPRPALAAAFARRVGSVAR